MKIVMALFLIAVCSIFYILPSNLIAQVPGWAQKESIPTQVARKYVRDGGAMVTVPGSIDNDLILAFRGNRSWEFYKYQSNCWTQLESIPYGVYPTNPTQINRKKVDEGAALCYDGCNTIYATKGGGTIEFWVYDIVLDTWVAKPFVPSERGLRGGTSLAYFNDKVYLLAGEQSVYAPTNFFAYNTSTNVWAPLVSAPLIPDGRTFRDGSCIVQLNGIIYALKGGGKHNYFWAYNVETNTWTQMETLPLIHPCNQTGDDSEDEIEISDLKGSADRVRKTNVKAGGAMTAGNDKIYAIKGGGAQDFWQHSFVSGWTPLDTIPRLNRQSVPKRGAALTYTNGRVYLLKGNNTPEFWAFTPPTATTISAEQGSSLANNTCPFMLCQNLPNPFNSLTAIRYSIPRECNVSLSIFNISGKLVKTLINETMNGGIYTVHWNGTDNDGRKISQGVYFYVLKTAGEKMQKKMLMLR